MYTYSEVTFVNFIVATVSFDQSTYSVNEDDGPAKPVLVLSNPSSTDIAINLSISSNTTSGIHKCTNCFYIVVFLHT